MRTRPVAVYFRCSLHSRTLFLGRFRYETGGNFTTFREMVMVTCPEIRRCDWQMHWIENYRTSHEIKDDSSLNLFERRTNRRPKKIYVRLLQRWVDLNPGFYESFLSNYFRSTMSDPSNSHIPMNASLNLYTRRSNNHGNGNQQRSSNPVAHGQQPDIEGALNIIRSAMGFSNEGDGLDIFLHEDILRVLELLQ